MKRIEKKAWPEYFESVASGKKNFDLRLNDFEAGSGDVLVLKEWDPAKGEYTGRELERTIAYVARFDGATLEQMYTRNDIEQYGLQVLSFK